MTEPPQPDQIRSPQEQARDSSVEAAPALRMQIPAEVKQAVAAGRRLLEHKPNATSLVLANREGRHILFQFVEEHESGRRKVSYRYDRDGSLHSKTTQVLKTLDSDPRGKSTTFFLHTVDLAECRLRGEVHVRAGQMAFERPVVYHFESEHTLQLWLAAFAPPAISKIAKIIAPKIGWSIRLMRAEPTGEVKAYVRCR